MIASPPGPGSDTVATGALAPVAPSSPGHPEPADHDPDGTDPGGRPSRPETREQVGAGLVLTGVLVLLGVVVGGLWSSVAPVARFTWSQFGDVRDWSDPGYEVGRFFVAEAELGVLCAACGLVVAIVLRRKVQQHGWPLVVALVLGGALASVVAWRTGAWLGPDAGDAATRVVGAVIAQPFRLRAPGMLLLWPLLSAFVALWVVASAPDPERARRSPVVVDQLAAHVPGTDQYRSTR